MSLPRYEKPSSAYLAIETTWKGFSFRSRLEARWAILFDALGIEFWYEPQRYGLPSKDYIPDFYLPHLNMFAEVKPEYLNERAYISACELCRELKKSMLLLVGPPDFRGYQCLFLSPIDDEINIENALLDIDYHKRKLYEKERRLFASFESREFRRELDFSREYREAVYASRSARFDGGVAA